MNKERLSSSESNGESAISLIDRSTNLAAEMGGLSQNDFLDVCKKTIPDFHFFKLINGEYSEEEVGQIETAVEDRKTKQSMLPPSNRGGAEAGPAEKSGSAETAAPAETAGVEAAPARPHTVTAEVGGTNGENSDEKYRKALDAALAAEAARNKEEDEERRSKNKKVGAVALLVAGALAAGGLAGGAIVHNVENQNVDKAPVESTQEDEADQAVEDEETAESAEGLQIREDYRGGYEDEDGNHVHGYADETGKHTNPNKIGRTGEVAPYNYDEAFTYESHDQFIDHLDEDAHRQMVLFAGRYSMLDDSVKPEKARGLDDTQLVELMRSDPAAHQEIVDSFSALLHAETTQSGATQVTGDFTNKFVEPTVEDGVMLGDRNLENRHCITHEDGSDVVYLTYALPGGGTDTVYFRMACGLQPIAETGTPQSDRIIEHTPEMPTPDPEKPTPDKPTPEDEDEPGGGDEELKEKTPFTEDQVFNRGDEAAHGKEEGDDQRAIREETKTPEPEVQQQNPVEQERQEAAPVSEPAQEAVQQTTSHAADPSPAETQARQTQDQADSSGHDANQASQKKTSTENAADRQDAASQISEGTSSEDLDF